MSNGVSKPGIHNIPECSVLSYIARNIGVAHAVEGAWAHAGEAWKKAIEDLPTNATAHYLRGCFNLEQGSYKEGICDTLNCISLDPDFRLAYVGLSSLYLLDGSYELALEACQGCLRRFPDAGAQAQFNMGQAIYQMLRSGESALRTVGMKKFGVAVRALWAAKRRGSEHWVADDDCILHYFLVHANQRAKLPVQPVRIWKVYGWRP